MNKKLDPKLFHGTDPSEERRTISVALPAYQMDALKAAHINMSAVMRDAIDRAYKIITHNAATKKESN